MASVMVAGWLMERIGRAAEGESDPFLKSRKAAADFFLAAIVPEALGLGAAAGTGAEMLYGVPAETLA